MLRVAAAGCTVRATTGDGAGRYCRACTRTCGAGRDRASTSSTWEEGDERVQGQSKVLWRASVEPTTRRKHSRSRALSSLAHHPHERCPFLVNLLHLTLRLTTADKQTAHHNAGNRLDQRRLINLLGVKCVRPDMVHCAAASTPLPGSLTS
jgi:hypothetical protein